MIKSLEAKQPVSAQPATVQVMLGLSLILVLAFVSWWITQQVYAIQLPFGIPGKALEYPLWAALAGLVGNLLLHLTGQRETVRPGLRTELFLKIGLVLMGAGINLSLIATAAGGAVIQTIVLVSSVFFFSWWVSGKFGMDEKLRAVMSSALAVCGVSAAIAAAGSVSARKEQVTYVTGLVILFALPMMVIAPMIGKAIGLSEPVAGAWFGGNIDTTAAVVGAGTMYGETAQKIATIVKSTQNTLIGLVAFLLAVYFASQGEGSGEKQRPSARMIWDRFPKFVLGFVLASVLFTLGWIDGGKGTAVEALKNWAFTMAFVSMGLEFSISEFRRMGWKPVGVFMIVTVFNTLVALLAAWVIFTFIAPIPG
jgi:uncharacterized integral membrane protein (TIGR00698 family)